MKEVAVEKRIHMSCSNYILRREKTKQEPNTNRLRYKQLHLTNKSRESTLLKGRSAKYVVISASGSVDCFWENNLLQNTWPNCMYIHILYHCEPFWICNPIYCLNIAFISTLNFEGFQKNTSENNSKSIEIRRSKSFVCSKVSFSRPWQISRSATNQTTFQWH